MTDALRLRAQELTSEYARLHATCTDELVYQAVDVDPIIRDLLALVDQQAAALEARQQALTDERTLREGERQLFIKTQAAYLDAESALARCRAALRYIEWVQINSRDVRLIEPCARRALAEETEPHP